MSLASGAFKTTDEQQRSCGPGGGLDLSANAHPARWTGAVSRIARSCYRDSMIHRRCREGEETCAAGLEACRWQRLMGEGDRLGSVETSDGPHTCETV